MLANFLAAKLDFSSLYCETTLTAVVIFKPEIYKFSYLAYDKATHIKFFNHNIFHKKGLNEAILQTY